MCNMHVPVAPPANPVVKSVTMSIPSESWPLIIVTVTLARSSPSDTS